MTPVTSIKEKALTEIGQMPDSDIVKLFPFIDLIKQGVAISSTYRGHPVIKATELSKLDDLPALFDDGFECDG